MCLTWLKLLDPILVQNFNITTGGAQNQFRLHRDLPWVVCIAEYEMTLNDLEPWEIGGNLNVKNIFLNFFSLMGTQTKLGSHIYMYISLGKIQLLCEVRSDSTKTDSMGWKFKSIILSVIG